MEDKVVGENVATPSSTEEGAVKECTPAPAVAGERDMAHTGVPAPAPHAQRALHMDRSPLAAFLPDRIVSPAVMRLIVLAEIVIALLIWWQSPYKVLPRPDEVFRALGDLWMHQGLGPELVSSFQKNLMALGWTALISLGLSYLTVLPVFRPIVTAISKGRFLSLVGFTFIFNLILQGNQIPVALLTLSMTVFFLTSMASVVEQIPRESFDYAHTLQMGEWRVVWEVVILGTIDKAFEVFRQNAAIGWMMLTMIEGMYRQGGGVGVLLVDENKHLLLAQVFAIQMVILVVGLCQDYVIGVLRRFFCPYADLALERNGNHK